GTLVKNIYDALVSTKLKRIDLSSAEIAKRAGEKNEMAVNSALYLLERAGHMERSSTASSHSEQTTKRNRTIVMLDDPPATHLRTNQTDVVRRGELERRKLREMIEFCYADRCFRAYILDYFGDLHHARQCGTCGNCRPLNRADKLEPKLEAEPLVNTPRPLNSDELLRVRKILACARRMKGRFGKRTLAATLRGSASKSVLDAQLNDLSTYGLLKDMAQDEILLFIEALVSARCLNVTKGQYPTVSITEFGNRVMLEKDKVELTLPMSDML